MPTVDVRITSMYPPGEVGSIRGYASATIDSCLAIRGIKVVEGGERGLFVSMPSRKTTEGYKEVCFPVTAEFREQLHNVVLSSYQQALEQAVSEAIAEIRPQLTQLDEDSKQIMVDSGMELIEYDDSFFQEILALDSVTALYDQINEDVNGLGTILQEALAEAAAEQAE